MPEQKQRANEDLTKTATGFTPSSIPRENKLSCLFCGTELNKKDTRGDSLLCLNCGYPHVFDFSSK